MSDTRRLESTSFAATLSRWSAAATPARTSPDFSSLAFASALGSSGLTTGPYIAYLLAQYFNHPEISWDSSNYQKDIKNYINIEKTGN